MTRRQLLALITAAAFGAEARQTREWVTWLSAASLLRNYRLGSLTRGDVIDACLDRIGRINPRINAFVTVTADLARERARSLDRQPAAAIRGELAGVPVAHKDLFETAGVRTTAGSRLFERHVPARDATVVRRLAAADAITLGKTNTHELGGGVTTINPFFGTTRNPWDLTRIAGGSSGGSAAAVAAGLAAIATGSDTGGSVRIPAAFCGCIGFKPTFGRVSTAGLLGASPTFDHSGVLTRTVEDARLAFRVLAGYDPADPSTSTGPDAAAPPPSAASITRMRIGIARNYFFESLAPAVGRAVERLIAALGTTRAELRDIHFPIEASTMARVFDPIIVAEIHERFAGDWQARPDAFSNSFAGFFQAPLPSGLALAAAHRALRGYQRAVRELFETVDLVLTPTVPITAPPIDARIDGGLILRNTWPFNAARTPVISLPAGFDEQGLPIAVQLAAGPYRDEMLLAAAEAVAAFHPEPGRRPAL